jgi:hypothetical protein
MKKVKKLVGATINVVHQPTGTKYGSSTNTQGGYVIPAARVGGPYVIKVTYIGYKTKEVSDINTSLGLTTNIDVVLVEESKSLKDVVVVGTKTMCSQKTKRG